MKESKEERFCRVAETRVNKIIRMIRLLGNCSRTQTYACTEEQVEQIFSTLQTELDTARNRYAIIHGDEFSCLEFHMNRDTINWIRTKLNTGGRYGRIKETYP